MFQKELTRENYLKKIKSIKFKETIQYIYLCSSVLKEKFRRKGLATEGVIKLINKVTHNLREKPTLFYDSYSKEGEALAKYVATKMKLNLLPRNP